jgi:hypothetical protein
VGVWLGNKPTPRGFGFRAMGKGFSPRVAGDDGVLGGRKSSGKILDGSSLALVFGWRRIKEGGR